MTTRLYGRCWVTRTDKLTYLLKIKKSICTQSTSKQWKSYHKTQKNFISYLQRIPKTTKYIWKNEQRLSSYMKNCRSFPDRKPAPAGTERVSKLRTRHQASRRNHVSNARRAHHEFVLFCILMGLFHFWNGTLW